MDYRRKLDRFCGKYRIKYYNTGRNIRHMTRLLPQEALIAEHLQNVLDEPIIALEMPESAVAALVEFHEQVEGLARIDQYAQKMIEESQQDFIVRHRNPAVREAYEQYRVLLELAR